MGTYGGPPHDEILPRFGILSYELPARVREIASGGLRLNLTSGDRAPIARALAAVERTSQFRNDHSRSSSGPR